jgi:peptidoglycan hydrolase-like protein with peptidoglycan-binding domain
VAHDSLLQNLDVLDNDSDSDNESLQIISVTPFVSMHGDALLTSPPTMIGYSPEPGFCGDDQFFYTITDNQGGTAQATVTVHVVGCDTTTEPPTLTLPANNATYYNTNLLTVTFTLPELLIHNSLTLTFTPVVGSPIVMNLMDAPSGTSTFSFDTRSSIDTIPEVVTTSATSIPPGNYTVTLTYQDQYGNPAAHTSALNVTIANSPSPTIESVNSGSVVLLGCQDSHATNYNKSSANNSLGCTYTTQSTQPTETLHFERNLSLGISGDDVVLLQQFLNSHGSPIALSGIGSKGKETKIFGTKTKMALIKYQKAHGITPTGFLGIKTRTFIESVLRNN